jgi:hypothetical protein
LKRFELFDSNSPDTGHDDIKNGKIKLIPGDEVRAYFDAKFASRRS